MPFSQKIDPDHTSFGFDHPEYVDCDKVWLLYGQMWADWSKSRSRLEIEKAGF